MNTVHDMGGMQNYGPVVPERDEPPFHHDWERRALALTVAMGATKQWNLDQSRAARESLPPAQYLSSTYYEIWIAGLQKLLQQHGLLAGSTKPVPKLAADRVEAALRNRLGVARPATRDARFAVGDRVVTRNINPVSHTRLPRYCRGKPGTVTAVHGVHVFPDSNARGRGEDPQWLYNVRFDAKDLWGEDTTAAAVHVDCFEPYLEKA